MNRASIFFGTALAASSLLPQPLPLPRPCSAAASTSFCFDLAPLLPRSRSASTSLRLCRYLVPPLPLSRSASAFDYSVSGELQCLPTRFLNQSISRMNLRGFGAGKLRRNKKLKTLNPQKLKFESESIDFS